METDSITEEGRAKHDAVMTLRFVSLVNVSSRAEDSVDKAAYPVVTFCFNDYTNSIHHYTTNFLSFFPSFFQGFPLHTFFLGTQMKNVHNNLFTEVHLQTAVYDNQHKCM